MSRLLALTLWTLLAPALAAHASGGSVPRPVVAVLYFDNNTGDASLDVLQKGFADMMVTDLSAVEQLQVVEREKLQQLIDELKLQKTAYFDPKTAQRLGRGVGAQYAVAGSFQAVDPELRIDVRLVEIATAKVVLADKVTGQKPRLFDLQQRLVNKFVAGLELKLGQAPKLKSRAPDLATLLSYSRGIDLADQGKLQEATQQLATVVSKAPTFLLARERHEQLLARLKASEQRRTESLADASETLGSQAERFLQSRSLAELDQPEASTFLACRLIRMQYLVRALKPHLAPSHPHVILPGHESQALALMKLWRDQALAYVQESKAYFRRFSQTVNGTTYLPDTNLKLPPEDEELARQAKYGPLRFDEEAALEVARPLLMGRFEDGSDTLQVGPTLSDLDPSAEEAGFRLLTEFVLAAESLPPQQRELRARRVLELHGDALMLRGRVEEAVAKWQQFLDRFPTSNSFKFISDKIKTALGMGPNAHANAGTQFPQALAECDKSGILEGYSQELYRRLVTRGYKAARELFLELEARCGESRELRPYLRSLLVSSALSAAQARDCDTFHELMPRFVSLGGSQQDVNGYLKNYVPHCRKPGSEEP